MLGTLKREIGTANIGFYGSIYLHTILSSLHNSRQTVDIHRCTGMVDLDPNCHRIFLRMSLTPLPKVIKTSLMSCSISFPTEFLAYLSFTHLCVDDATALLSKLNRAPLTVMFLTMSGAMNGVI